jgi:hypothetical protein
MDAQWMRGFLFQPGGTWMDGSGCVGEQDGVPAVVLAFVILLVQ